MCWNSEFCSTTGGGATSAAETNRPVAGRFSRIGVLLRYMALPQTTTVIVGLSGSFVVNVIVAPVAPAAVGSTVTVYDVLGAADGSGGTQAFVPGGTSLTAFGRVAEQFVVVFVNETLTVTGPSCVA